MTDVTQKENLILLQNNLYISTVIISKQTFKWVMHKCSF